MLAVGDVGNCDRKGHNGDIGDLGQADIGKK